MSELKGEVEDLSSRLDSIEDQPQSNNDVDTEIVQLNTMVDAMDDRLSVIESSIVEDPRRALELPLLRAEMENMSERMQEDREDAASAVDDVRTLVYASVAAIVLSLAGLLASTFVGQRFGKPTEANGSQTRRPAEDGPGGRPQAGRRRRRSRRP
jgi:hypothetical protein